MKINLQAVRNTFSPFSELSAIRYETLRSEDFKDHAITDIPSDSRDYHLVLYKSHEIAANFILSPENKDTICIKQITVREDVWHPGIEHSLLCYAESWAIENGFTNIKVNCGKTGIPFYSKLKYSSTDSSITENGIQYHQMYKKLGN